MTNSGFLTGFPARDNCSTSQLPLLKTASRSCAGPGTTVALAASSDRKILRSLANTIAQNSLAVYRAFSVAECRSILRHQQVCLIICEDNLTDGGYDDILNAPEVSSPRPPMIVVSRTGNWPDYLEAIKAGVFDYLAYPPIQGELPRAIRGALKTVSNTPKGEAL